MPIGELFSHMSGLYFRGKLTYARRFGEAFVITPDRGLVPAAWPITYDALVRFGAGDTKASLAWDNVLQMRMFIRPTILGCEHPPVHASDGRGF